MRIKITKPGIYGSTGQVPVGSEFDVSAEPTRWTGRYEAVSTKGKTAVTNPAKGATQQPAYEAKHRGGGSYSVMAGDEEVVEKLDKAEAEQFNAMGDAEKAEYVKANG